MCHSTNLERVIFLFFWGGGATFKRLQWPLPLLVCLPGMLCFYRIEDWWTYELCYKKHVRQFHKEGEKIVTEVSGGVGGGGQVLSNLADALKEGTRPPCF
jgi:Glucosidase II beta subunit-like protein